MLKSPIIPQVYTLFVLGEGARVVKYPRKFFSLRSDHARGTANLFADLNGSTTVLFVSHTQGKPHARQMKLRGFSTTHSSKGKTLTAIAKEYYQRLFDKKGFDCIVE